MIAAIHIESRSTIPSWIGNIERTCFGEAWSSMCENEHIWAIPFVGFARWKLAASIQEAELLRIGVANNSRRNGYGRAILQYSQSQIANLGINHLFLEVRVSNVAARSLYQSEGWVCMSLRSHYYCDGEDAMNYQFCGTAL